ncbi:EAL domain-containing protein [Candidatus Reidiella endopervernicosa]|uniref:EAL domain-containing protein n=1 Tax=Candidatus Reidiella endopervernicosa TaxID=2738883 RepID=UPI0023512334|nr:EAL domain-containing protein [Candidatus Reidiella endopervernicosa]
MAKNAGRNTIKLYEQDDEKLQRLDSELDWTIRVNRILEEERIEPYIQEIAPISGQGKMHYEVLMRVVDREGKVEPPAEFIDAAEKHNLMHEVDRKMISKIFSWIDANPDAMREVGKLSINLSGQSLGSERLLEYVFEQLSTYSVPRKKICFEITETAAIGNFEDASDFIDEMRNLGCSFSLDDFGSGLSSYSYLKKLPVDYLKIDGVLVKDICTEPNDYAMVRSIKEVAHFMEKKVIAEYAENDAVVEKLAEIGVDYVQGYAIARPHPIADLEV